MDSTAAAEEAAARSNAKRARLTTTSAGDVDLISGLDDDVLLRVLALVPDARDAVRTGALSRRWLLLWTRVAALRFASSRPVSMAARGAKQALHKFVSFVNDVLAQRIQSDDCNDIETLSISYTSGPGRLEELRMQVSVHATQGWIRYAFQHGVKHFILDLAPCLSEPVVVLGQLHSPSRLETMSLALGYSRLRLPDTMKFASLVELSLERINIAPGEAHLLGRLLSSVSCPHLQKLSMIKVSLYCCYEEMQIEADTLKELWIEGLMMLRSLKLRTPILRVLHIHRFSDNILTISAPKLEDLAISFHQKAENEANILLLKQCRSLTCLNVTLHGQEDGVDMIKSRVPQLPHITSLTVYVSYRSEHDFGAGVASLLTRLSNLTHLSLHLPFPPAWIVIYLLA